MHCHSDRKEPLHLFTGATVVEESPFYKRILANREIPRLHFIRLRQQADPHCITLGMTGFANVDGRRMQSVAMQNFWPRRQTGLFHSSRRRKNAVLVRVAMRRASSKKYHAISQLNDLLKYGWCPSNAFSYTICACGYSNPKTRIINSTVQ